MWCGLGPKVLGNTRTFPVVLNGLQEQTHPVMIGEEVTVGDQVGLVYNPFINFWVQLIQL